MRKILILLLCLLFTSCFENVIVEKVGSSPFTIISVTREDYYDGNGQLLPTTYFYKIGNGYDNWYLRTRKIYSVNDTIEITKK